VQRIVISRGDSDILLRKLGIGADFLLVVILRRCAVNEGAVIGGGVFDAVAMDAPTIGK
jgi:hypothetical protein